MHLFFFNRALQFPPEGWLRMSLNNGSITHLVIRPNGRVALRTLGDTGFMPPDKITRTWMSKTDGCPAAASSLFALVHSATVPLDFYVTLGCDAVLKCPLAPCLLHIHICLSVQKRRNLCKPEDVQSSSMPQNWKLSCGIQRDWMSVCSAVTRALTLPPPHHEFL